MARIYCPGCGRILGDTDENFSGNVNCKNCKKTRVVVHQLERPDYLKDDGDGGEG